LKFIPLNDSGTNYLTFGLENRTEFQYLNNNDWGAGPQNVTGDVLERLMPDIDLRLGDQARVFVTLAFNEFTGKYPRRESIRTSPMDMKVSSSSVAICTIRIPRLLKRAAGRAGMNVDLLGGHSLRAGCVTQAALNGVREFVIMRQTGRKTVATLRRYIRSGEIFRENAAAGLGI
jgi:hypothetical protein